MCSYKMLCGALVLMMAVGVSPASAERAPTPRSALLTPADVETALETTVSRGRQEDQSAVATIVSAGILRGPLLDSLQNPWSIDERDVTKLFNAAGLDQSDDVKQAIKRLFDEHYAINILGAVRKTALLANDKLPAISNELAEEIATALVMSKYSPVAGSLKTVGNVEHKGLHPVLLYGKGQNGVFRYFGVMINNRGDVLHDDGADFPDLLRWGRIPNEYELERL